MRLYDYIGYLAMVAAPAAAAINFGWSAYVLLWERTQWLPLAALGGALTAVGMEAVGVLAGHLAVALYHRRDNRWPLAAVAMLVYVAVGTYELLDVPMARFMPLLAALVYVLVGLRDSMVTAVQGEAQATAEDLAWRRKMEAGKARMRHEEKLARIAVKAQQSQHKPALEQKRASTSQHECEDCGQSYGTVQALNAHGRWCKAKVSTNGAR